MVFEPNLESKPCVLFRVLVLEAPVHSSPDKDMSPDQISDLLSSGQVARGQWGMLILVLGILVGSVPSVRGQSTAQGHDPEAPDYVQTQWTPQEGLPVNSVNDLVQTKDRPLWLATFDGLARFDGRNFMTFRSGQYEGLPSSRFIEAFSRSDGLWLRTQQGYLVRLKGRTFTTVAEEVASTHSAPDGPLWVGLEKGVAVWKDGHLQRLARQQIQGSVQAILRASDGSVWVGTQSQGAYRRMPDGELRHLTGADGLPSSTITALAEGPDGAIWIGTRSGLARWAGALDLVPSSPPPLHIRALRMDNEGHCWALTDRGIYQCKPDRLVPVHQMDADVDPMLLPTKFVQRGPEGHTFWALDQTLYRDGSPIFETDNYITEFLHDQQGNLWIGTIANGLFRLRESLFTVYGEPEGLETSFILPIEQTKDGDVWLGTLDGGLTRLTDSGPVTHFLNKGGRIMDRVWALHEDRSGQLWVGGEARLCQFEDGQCARPEEVGPISAHIRTIYEDREGRLWSAPRTDSTGGKRERGPGSRRTTVAYPIARCE